MSNIFTLEHEIKEVDALMEGAPANAPTQPARYEELEHLQISEIKYSKKKFYPFNTGAHFDLEICVRLDHFIAIIKGLWTSKINGQSLYYFNPHISF
ncbi:hypothetical protein E2C01_102076 [Portunus trituberculatus]|uniref:Uncharacterized protein n=1 Tax=Portunus trituberculatus TaxID=210409 RepID=A0A5B7K767_PORTR|nr:hypothetical protein [Portunus trituberculatus]